LSSEFNKRNNDVKSGQNPGCTTSTSYRLSFRLLHGCLAVLLAIMFLTPAIAGEGDGGFKNKPAPFLPITIFQPTDQPGEALNNDGQSIEVGVKFRTTQGGTISAIRYYKGAGTTGTHVGSLWTSAGTKLAEITFTGETSSGWQQMALSQAITIEAGVTYVASIYSPSGHYASTSQFFTNAATNGSIKALADGEDGANGLYKYGTSGFPASSSGKSNYWVDVVFNPTEGGGGSGTINGTTNYIPKFTASNAIGNSILFDNGSSIGIGTTNVNDASYKLYVEAGIKTRKVKVDVANWPDYVFADKYKLPTLQDVEKYISEHKHLPDIPSAREVEETGLNLGDNQAMLLKKIEELTLYLIEQNKANEQMQLKIKELEEKIQKLSQSK